MKTKLPNQILTVEEAKKFLNELYLNDEISLVQERAIILLQKLPRAIVNKLFDLRDDINKVVCIQDHIRLLNHHCVESWRD